MLSETYDDETVAILENEFGEIGIDGEFLSGYNRHIKEITSGCICCSLYGDFVIALRQMIEELHPSRILVEPTGLGRSNDIMRACNEIVQDGTAQINAVITIVDATMFSAFMEIGGELYRNQIKTAHTLVVSHVEDYENEEVLCAVIRELSTLNPHAYIIAEAWGKLSALTVLTIAEEKTQKQTETATKVHPHPHHHHHDNEGFSVIACHPTEHFTETDLQSLFSAVSDGRYGKIFRAKCILTMKDGHRIKGDYVYGKWKQTSYPGKGEDKLILIGKDLLLSKENGFTK